MNTAIMSANESSLSIYQNVNGLSAKLSNFTRAKPGTVCYHQICKSIISLWWLRAYCLVPEQERLGRQ